MTNAPIAEAIYQINFWRGIFKQYADQIQRETETSREVDAEEIAYLRRKLVETGDTILKYWDDIEREIGNRPFDEAHKESLHALLGLPHLRVVYVANRVILNELEFQRLTQPS